MWARGFGNWLECFGALLDDLREAGIPWYVWASFAGALALGWFLAG